MANAQVTITKDNSFGTNGTVTIPGVGSNNYPLLIPNIHSTFQGNKIFVSYPSATSSETQFIRLNSDGSPDNTFGTNGNILIPYFEAYYFYANNDFFLTTGNKKYLSDGQPDTSFSEAAMQATNWQYKIGLSDGKIFFRDDTGFYKFLSDGTPDSSYGTNGAMAINAAVAGDPNGNSTYEFFFNKGNALYEYIYPSAGQSNIRKVDINTGNLDASYGQGGYAQITNSNVPSGASHGYSVQASQNDGSMINILNDSNNIYFTKTNTQGNLDLSIGANGVITGSKSFSYNGSSYEVGDDQLLPYSNLLFVPAENSAQELGIACYSLTGNNVTINNNTFYPLAGTSFTSQRYVFVKDNYIYVIHDNNISRFVIQQQVLSAKEISDKNTNVHVTNPFKDTISIHADEPVKEIEIADMNGKILVKGKALSLDTSSLLIGTYFIKIHMESGKVVSKKVLKN
ncbi:hypothetical protein CHA01nite_39290 [Chryseobacterium hagamense]|uniref:Secretion system C-terminal sorting domain-containing protein n=2 Tax=Chryseobacterium hagamense TaxID=395935 RepID=A0A511YSM4_9FLAO|nr:hypothetical protein CHA01nite_39290 [Chryseobacterium hagamense]